MKTIIVLFLMFVPTLFAADAKTEVVELKKKLAASEAALAAHVKADQSATNKLADAVQAATETNTEKIDAVIQSQKSGEKALEKVGVATQVATKKLADVVTTGQAAVVTAITTNTRQAEKALAAARETARKAEAAARKAEENSRNLAKTAEEIKMAKEKSDEQAARAYKRLDELVITTNLAAAKDETALRLQRMKLVGELATPFIQGVCGILLAFMVVLQIRASMQQKAMYGVVNGRHSEALEKVERLEKENRSLRGGRDDGHPST